MKKMTRKLQKAGHKPRSSSRYKRMTSRVRGFVTSEINRVLNRLVSLAVKSQKGSATETQVKALSL